MDIPYLLLTTEGMVPIPAPALQQLFPFLGEMEHIGTHWETLSPFLPGSVPAKSPTVDKKTARFSVRTDPALKARLEAVAAHHDRSSAWLITQYIKQGLHRDELRLARRAARKQ